MATVDFHPPKQPQVNVHLVPGQGPQGWFDPWIQWIQDFFASLGELLLPEILDDRITYAPSLSKYASYETFRAYVNHDLDSAQNLSERNIAQLRADDQEGLNTEIGRMEGILKMVTDAGSWIKAHEEAFGNKGLEAVQINQKLFRTQQLVAQLFPHIRDRHSLKSPGLDNPTLTHCFMNAALQGIFGDPVCREHIALHKKQHPIVQQHALQFHQASRENSMAPLSLSAPIRELYPLLRSGQQDTTEAIQQLIDPLDGPQEWASGNPLIHKMTQRTTFDQEAFAHVRREGLTHFEENVLKDESFLYCPEFSFEKGLESNALESYLEQYCRPQGPSSTLDVSFRMDTGRTKRLTGTIRRQFVRRPEYLFLSFKRIIRSYDGARTKIEDPVELGTSFYLHPEHIATDEGGKYEVRWFNCHLGGDNSGHYIHYRKVDGTWFCFNDSKVSEATEETVQSALKTCYILFAGRIACPDEEITAGAAANIAAAKAKQLKEDIKKAQQPSPLPKGNTFEGKKEHLERIRIFNSLLSSDEPDPETLTQMFDRTPPEFQNFCKSMLIHEQKMDLEDNVHDHLIELNAINDPYLTTHQAHIGWQYYHAQQQQLEMLRDQLDATNENLRILTRVSPTEAHQVSLRSLSAYSAFKTQRLSFLLELHDTHPDIVMEMGNILLPDLTTAVGERPLQEALQALHQNAVALTQHIEAS